MCFNRHRSIVDHDDAIYLSLWYNHNMSTEFITEYYPNGNKHVQGYYDGTNPDGDFTLWYENGNKKSEGCYLGKNKKYSDPMVNRDEFTGGYNNPRIGKWNYWHSNGQLACTGIHHSDSAWIFWDESGKLVLPSINVSQTGLHSELVQKV